MTESNDIDWFVSDIRIGFSDEQFAELTSSQKRNLIAELEKLSFAKTETYFPPMPPDVIGFLIPKTRIVIKGPPFLYALFKTIFSALVVNNNDSWAAYVLAISAVGDAIKDLKSSIYRLNINNGEVCTYSSIYGESWEVLEDLRIRSIKRKGAWKAHKPTRDLCEIKKCKFHKSGCTLKRGGFDEIVDNLIEKELIVLSDDEKKIRVIL